MQKEIGGDNTYFNLWNADNNTNSNVYNDNPVTKPYTTLAQWVSRCHQAIPLQDSPQQGKTSPILLLNITENGIVAFQDGTSIADQTRLEEQFSSL